jgi:hypothetical protein
MSSLDESGRKANGHDCDATPLGQPATKKPNPSAAPRHSLVQERVSGHQQRAATCEHTCSLEAQRDQVYEEVKKRLDHNLNDEAQHELARLLSIVEQAKCQSLPQIIAEARVAISALLRKGPKLQLAQTIRYRLEMELLRHDGRFTSYLVKTTNGNPTVIVSFGILITLVIALIYNISLSLETRLSLIHLAEADAFTVAMAAFFGGVVSVLSRLHEFSKLRVFDPVFLFCNGLLKPYVGIILGIFVYALLKCGFIVVPGIEASAQHVWYVLGFLSGFSERFTKDLISRGEGVLASSKKS